MAEVYRLAENRGYRADNIKNIEAQQRREHAAAAAKKRAKEDAEEAEWRAGVARKWAYSRSLEEVLPRREDRVRFYRGSNFFKG